MKNIKKILFCTIIIILALLTNVEAHNKNITGCNEKDSKEIIQNDGKYYGYHNEDEVRHYHQVEWDEENQKWKIVNPAVYYDENSSKEDPYNRILAWIWVDDSLLQKELTERGLAETYMLQNNYRYAGILQLAEEEAKENKVGIWNDGTEIGDKLDIEQDENSGFIGILIIIILMIIAILAGNRKKKQNNQ